MCGEEYSKTEHDYCKAQEDKIPFLSDSCDEGIPNMADDNIDDHVSIDAFGLLLNTFDAPKLREEIFVIDDHSPFLSILSHGVFSPMDMENHAQMDCLSMQQPENLGSHVFDEYPNDGEQPPTSIFVDMHNDQLVYDCYKSELYIDSQDQIISLVSKDFEYVIVEEIKLKIHSSILVPLIVDPIVP